MPQSMSEATSNRKTSRGAFICENSQVAKPAMIVVRGLGRLKSPGRTFLFLLCFELAPCEPLEKNRAFTPGAK